MNLKRTPLYSEHQRLGAKLIDFGGWEMPVQYSSVMEEHQTVRTAAGLFDISHMGEFIFSGPGAAVFLNRLLTNDVSRLGLSQAQYTLMCNPSGGVVDDLYLYRMGGDLYLAIVNASRMDADAAWIERQLQEMAEPEVKFTNASEEYGAIALQGPRAADIMDASFPGAVLPDGGWGRPSALRKNEVASVGISIGAADQGGFVARTGYTGEDGFEVVAPVAVLQAVWNKLLNIGEPYGIRPAGLGARDTLRTEACLPLYGHELDEETTPIEAGLGTFVALGKPEFVGRAALQRWKEEGVTRKLAAFRMEPRSAPPRPGYKVFIPGTMDAAGIVTSGTQSPTLGCGIGLAYLPPELAVPETEIEVEVRGRRFRGKVQKRPLYKKPV